MSENNPSLTVSHSLSSHNSPPPRTHSTCAPVHFCCPCDRKQGYSASCANCTALLQTKYVRSPLPSAFSPFATHTHTHSLSHALISLVGDAVQLKIEHRSFKATQSKTVDISTIASAYHIEINPRYACLCCERSSACSVSLNLWVTRLSSVHMCCVRERANVHVSIHLLLSHTLSLPHTHTLSHSHTLSLTHIHTHSAQRRRDR